ncbi:MAG: hypothetical protein PHZ00_08105 [Candidatus Peribacteraceae bacterium]|nr:hypothetical protein [Candidatus Peribacteraceae bacterium]
MDGKQRLAQPMWVNSHNTQDQPVAHYGFFVEERTCTLFRNRLRYLADQLVLAKSETERENLLNALKKTVVQFLGANPSTTIEQAMALEYFGSRLDFDLLHINLNDILRMDEDEYHQWTNRIRANGMTMEQPSMTSMNMNGGKEKMVFVNYDNLP